MLSRAMIDQARRVAWRCRPRMSGARARAWARADRETFGISREGGPAGIGGARGKGDSGRSHPETDRRPRALPSSASDGAGRNEASVRRRYWWEGRED